MMYVSKLYKYNNIIGEIYFFEILGSDISCKCHSNALIFIFNILLFFFLFFGAQLQLIVWKKYHWNFFLAKPNVCVIFFKNMHVKIM
jgi:hypothetical protein